MIKKGRTNGQRDTSSIDDGKEMIKNCRRGIKIKDQTIKK